MTNPDTVRRLEFHRLTMDIHQNINSYGRWNKKGEWEVIDQGKGLKLTDKKVDQALAKQEGREEVVKNLSIGDILSELDRRGYQRILLKNKS